MEKFDKFSKNKSAIIELLLYNGSLTAKQIFYRLVRQFSLNLTYQAIHKTLKQMVDDKILVKDDSNFYDISKDWAKNNLKEAEYIYKKVDKKIQLVNLSVLKEYDSMNLVFDGILSLGWFLTNDFMQYTNHEKRPCLALWRFCYSIVGLDKEYLDGLKKSFKVNHWFVFVEENNPLDRTFGQTLQTYGLKDINFGIKCATNLCDFMINGDFILEICYPSSFRKVWELQNRSPKNITEFDLGSHFLLMREINTKINVILTKNKTLADEYRKEYIK